MNLREEVYQDETAQSNGYYPEMHADGCSCIGRLWYFAKVVKDDVANVAMICTGCGKITYLHKYGPRLDI